MLDFKSSVLRIYLYGEPKNTPEIEFEYLPNMAMMFKPEIPFKQSFCQMPIMTSDDIDLYLFFGLFQGRWSVDILCLRIYLHSRELL